MSLLGVSRQLASRMAVAVVAGLTLLAFLSELLGFPIALSCSITLLFSAVVALLLVLWVHLEELRQQASSK